MINAVERSIKRGERIEPDVDRKSQNVLIGSFFEAFREIPYPRVVDVSRQAVADRRIEKFRKIIFVVSEFVRQKFKRQLFRRMRFDIGENFDKRIDLFVSRHEKVAVTFHQRAEKDVGIALQQNVSRRFLHYVFGFLDTVKFQKERQDLFPIIRFVR